MNSQLDLFSQPQQVKSEPRTIVVNRSIYRAIKVRDNPAAFGLYEFYYKGVWRKIINYEIRRRLDLLNANRFALFFCKL